MNKSPRSMITVDRDYLASLEKKALAWDELQEELEKIYSDRLRDDMISSPTLGGKLDKNRAVPFGQTIIITNLPCTANGTELMNSVLALGGIRCYQMFSETGRGSNSFTALITFVGVNAARNYLSYVSKHGFFLSKKLNAGYNADPARGEYVHTSVDRKFQCLLKHLPNVTVKPWTGVERVMGRLITGDEGGYCDVPHKIRVEGATRVLVIVPGMEAKKVHEELMHLAAIPGLKIESNRLLPALPAREEEVTITRFCSVRDAVMAKNYLCLLKSFSGPEGRVVKYGKDPTDRPTEELLWHSFTGPQREEIPPTNGNSTPATVMATNTKLNPLYTEGTTTADEVDIPSFSSYRTTGSDTGESDVDGDVREMSFSLAKEAFLPYIITSRNGLCLPSLCHTPAPGDRTPPPLEHTPQPEQKSELTNHSKLEEGRPTTFTDDGGEIVTGTGTNSFLQTESISSRQKYPHEAYLSKGKSLEVLGKVRSFRNPGTVEKATEIPVLQVDTANEIYRSSALDAKPKPLSIPRLRSMRSSSSSLHGTFKQLAGMNTTAQLFHENEQLHPSTQQVAGTEHKKTELVMKPQLDKQTLNPVDWDENLSPLMGGSVSMRVLPSKKPPVSVKEDPLGDWEIDF